MVIGAVDEEAVSHCAIDAADLQPTTTTSTLLVLPIVAVTCDCDERVVEDGPSGFTLRCVNAG